VLKKKDIDDMGEVAKAAFSEGDVKHVLLTGGCFNHQQEIELVSSIIRSIRKHTGLKRVPGTILPSPAENLNEIEKYYNAGIFRLLKTSFISFFHLKNVLLEIFSFDTIV